MAETIQHTKLDEDPSVTAIDALQNLDLSSLSFVQLQRLKNALKERLIAAENEATTRASEDNSGDTVQVASHPAKD